MKSAEVAVVVGVGDGLGSALLEAFSAAGLTSVAIARDAQRLAARAARWPRTHAIALDATDGCAVGDAFEAIATRHGAPALVVCNVGAWSRAGVLKTSPDAFERAWRTNCLAAFHVAQSALEVMLPQARGTLIFTGATASLRGGSGFAAFAAAKHGVRALAQSCAREFGPQGIHVAHVVIDGRIDAHNAEQPDLQCMDPAAIAAQYLMLHRQPRSAWTLELDLRPDRESF